MATLAQPFVDHAAPILAGEPTITNEERSDLWDTFHESKDPNELVQHLTPLELPDDLKQSLYEAKQKSMPEGEPVDRAAAALAQIARLNPQVLELAESHPKVAALLVSSAAKGAEKAATEAAGARRGAKKGTEAAEPASAAPLAQPPRPDGLEHLPPIPDGHYRILASDGGIHDIPEENVERARAIDPRLFVLNP